MGDGLDIHITPEQYFWLNNGRVLKNITELLNALKSMEDSIFYHHVSSDRNDFANWIKHVFKNDGLSYNLYNSKTRDEMVKAIEAVLFHPDAAKQSEGHQLLEYKPGKKQLSGQFQKQKPQKNQEPKKFVRSFPFIKTTPKIISSPKPAQQEIILETIRRIDPKEIPADRISEILLKEKEIEKREEKIEEREARIEEDLREIAKGKEPNFFSTEFIQGLAIGILAASIAALVYIKFFI